MRSDVAHEEVVTTAQIHNPIKPQKMTKESKQLKLKMFLRDTATSSAKSKKPSPEIAARQQESSDKAAQKIKVQKTNSKMLERTQQNILSQFHRTKTRVKNFPQYQKQREKMIYYTVNGVTSQQSIKHI